MKMRWIIYWTIFLVLAVVSSSAKDHPIADNGSPLVFQIDRAIVTRETQSFRNIEISASPQELGQGSAHAYARNDPTTPDPSESFVIVTFRLSNVKRKIQLMEGDVQLVDGKGVSHRSVAVRWTNAGEWNPWSPFWTFELAPKKDTVTSIIFNVPTDRISGAVIRFQNSTYPVSVGN